MSSRDVIKSQKQAQRIMQKNYDLRMLFEGIFGRYKRDWTRLESSAPVFSIIGGTEAELHQNKRYCEILNLRLFGREKLLKIAKEKSAQQGR